MPLRNFAKFMLNPVLYLFLAMTVLLFIKRHRTRYIVGILIYFYVIAVPFTSQVFLNLWQMQDTFKGNVKYGAVVPLAGASDMDLYVGAINNTRTWQSFLRGSTNVERLLTAVNLVKKGNAGMILMGDWRFYAVSKEDRIKNYAETLSLKVNQFEIYGWVGRTVDEATGVSAYLRQHAIGRILLVTSATHMRRTQAVFKKQGLDFDILSVNRKSFIITGSSFVPSIGGLDGTYSCLYELFGYIGYYLQGYI